MEEFRRIASETSRSIHLLTPKLAVPCPHCKAIVHGETLTPLRPARPYEITCDGDLMQPIFGEEQIKMSSATEQMVLPTHAGVSPAELIQSREDARNFPFTPLYEVFADAHNKSAHAGRKTFVWGAGNPVTAKVLVIGEAPGWQEDKFGMPFIGDAGQVLSSVLASVGISRANDLFLTNTVLTIPDRNEKGEIGKPRSIDMYEQRARIMALIDILEKRPNTPLKAIVCLGKYPWVQLTEVERMKFARDNKQEVNMNDVSISKNRGWHTLNGIKPPVLAVYHPSYIMRLYKSSGQDPQRMSELNEYRDFFVKLKEKING